jgi:glycosyltransferase involved in cell wall biosynthesis
MIRRIACLSYTPLGYGSPQIQYLMRDLADHYGVNSPVGIFAPRWKACRDLDERFPDFSIHHFEPAQEHRAALCNVLPELIAYMHACGIKRVGLYGAGTHTNVLLDLWNSANGPEISILFTSEEPTVQTFSGIPVVQIDDVKTEELDFVVLSSQSFEEEMAQRMRKTLPGMPFAALYNSRLSRLPSGTEFAISKVLVPIERVQHRTDSASRWLDAYQPDLLICTHFMFFAAILKARHRPQSILYYALELPDGSDGSPLEPRYFDEHHQLAPYISLILFPEKERMKHYQGMFNLSGVPSRMVFNARPLKLSSSVSADARNGKVVLHGSLGDKANFIGYLPLRKEPIPHIDVFGQVQDHNRSREILLDTETTRRCGYSYLGFLDNDTLSKRRRDYSFAFVSWNPTTFDTFHACPNKFFEAIADGVPPIVAPHPQCIEIINKFDCGILLRDWSLAAFEQGLREARDVYGTERYLQLVDNCRKAHELELCWERQFEAIRPLLPRTAPVKRMLPRSRFVLLDPTLRNEVGHHYHYAQHVLSGARRLGFQTVAAINRSFDVSVSEADEVYPVYWYDFWGRDTSSRDLRPMGNHASKYFLKQTKQVFDALSLNSGDEVFVPNISDSDLAALIDGYEKGLFQRGPRWHLFLRHDLPDENGIRIRSMRAIHLAMGPEQVRFYSDTEALAEQHRSATGLPVTVLPIPVSAEPRVPIIRQWSNPLIIAYLGDARVEKGFHHLPELVRLCRDGISSGRLLFEIQIAGSGYDPQCEAASIELKKLQLNGGIRLRPEKLTTEEYLDLLGRADVLISLYDGQAYRRRSSNVVIEGICEGKGLLLTRGCAPAEILPSDCPWLCSTIREAADTLLRICSEESVVKVWPEAIAYQEFMAALHNGWRLSEMLVEGAMIGPVAPADAKIELIH